MAFIPLENPVEWGFDTAANQLMLRMRERDANDPEKIATREAIVRINVANVNLLPITQPVPPPV